jgi:hypothetical protein
MEGVFSFNTFDPDLRRIAGSGDVAGKYRKRTEFATAFRVDGLYGSYGKSYPRYPSTLVWIARKAMDVETARTVKNVGR